MTSFLDTFTTAWNKFFHLRVGLKQCRLSGWLRVAYATLFVLDRLLLTLDLDYLLSPSNGLLPYRLARLNPDLRAQHLTLFQLAPESDALLWTVHVAGLVHGCLLALGVAPRWQLFCVYINLLSFERHNYMIWDGEDEMFRTWAIFFVFLPLHHVTIWEWMQDEDAEEEEHDDDNDEHDNHEDKQHNDDNLQHDSNSHSPPISSSWPIWPFRLFQIEVCLLYYGATISKLDGPAWWNGTAMYMISYTNDFYPGIFNPDFLFDRVVPLKLMAWTALAIEAVSPVTVWIPGLTIPTVVVAFALHIGIDVTMNMHCFEWLALIGWSTFLIQPDHDDNIENHDKTKEKREQPSPSPQLNNDGNVNEDEQPSTPPNGDTKTASPSLNNDSKEEKKEVIQPPSKEGSKISNQQEQQRKRTMSGDNGRFRWLLNIFLVTFLSIIAFDTLPIAHLHSMALSTSLSQWTLPIYQFHNQWHQKLEPYLVCIGLDQGVWNMFHGNPDNENARLQAYITLEHQISPNATVSTETTWQQPDWSNMPWWQRKRMMRHMTFYEALEEPETSDIWVHFATKIAALYAKDPAVVVRKLRLVRHWEQGPPLPPDLGWNEPAHQPMTKTSENMVTIHACVDEIDDCDEWKSLCQRNRYVDDDCQKTCGLCPDSGYTAQWPMSESEWGDEEEDEDEVDEGEEHGDGDYEDEEEVEYDKDYMRERLQYGLRESYVEEEEEEEEEEYHIEHVRERRKYGLRESYEYDEYDEYYESESDVAVEEEGGHREHDVENQEWDEGTGAHWDEAEDEHDEEGGVEYDEEENEEENDKKDENADNAVEDEKHLNDEL